MNRKHKLDNGIKVVSEVSSTMILQPIMTTEVMKLLTVIQFAMHAQDP